MSRRIGGAAVVTAPDKVRSRLMGRVRRTGTLPELALRRALHRAGLRYRLDAGIGLPGTPDLALLRGRLAIFVDGCFWHGCRKHGTIPKTNRAFWLAKIERNHKRDLSVDQSLRGLGWRVVRVWEHELRSDMDAVVRRVLLLMKSRDV